MSHSGLDQFCCSGLPVFTIGFSLPATEGTERARIVAFQNMFAYLVTLVVGFTVKQVTAAPEGRTGNRSVLIGQDLCQTRGLPGKRDVCSSLCNADCCIKNDLYETESARELPSIGHFPNTTALSPGPG